MYVPSGPLPGPQHSRTTGSTLWYVARIVGLCVLAVALVSVPLAWVQRDPPPSSQADSSTTPDDEPTADELGFSMATPAPSERASDEPTAAVVPPPVPQAEGPVVGPTSKPTPTPTRSAKAKVKATAGAAAPPDALGDPAPAAAPPADPAPPAVPLKPPLVVPPPQTALTDDIVALTNAERANAGVPPLAYSQCLTDQANYRTAVLVYEDRFERESLDPVIAACGTGGGGIAENVSRGTGDAATMVQGWVGSSLLNPDFARVGVGCTLGPSGQVCSQIFTG